jgi:hypothetical protein
VSTDRHTAFLGERLATLIQLLGSNKSSVVLSAANTLKRTLRRNGLDLQALGNIVNKQMRDGDRGLGARQLSSEDMQVTRLRPRQRRRRTKLR